MTGLYTLSCSVLHTHTHTHTHAHTHTSSSPGNSFEIQLKRLYYSNHYYLRVHTSATSMASCQMANTA